MCKFIVLGVALAMSAAGATIFAFQLPLEPIDPAILHEFLQRGRDAMALF